MTSGYNIHVIPYFKKNHANRSNRPVKIDMDPDFFHNKQVLVLNCWYGGSKCRKKIRTFSQLGNLVFFASFPWKPPKFKKKIKMLITFLIS